VAAGEQARTGTVLAQQRKRVLDARRALVVERCRYLQDIPFSL
jgi:hypothetical protein